MCLHSPTVLWTGSLVVVLLEFYFALFGSRMVQIGIEAEILVQPPECSYSPVPPLVLLAVLPGQKACLWLLCGSHSILRKVPTTDLQEACCTQMPGVWPSLATLWYLVLLFCLQYYVLFLAMSCDCQVVHQSKGKVPGAVGKAVSDGNMHVVTQ